MQAYSNPAREHEPHALPDVETFYLSFVQFLAADDDSWMAEYMNDDGQTLSEDMHQRAKDLEGWYWWTCFPGCMPDSDPNGPFGTEASALEDAQNIE